MSMYNKVVFARRLFSRLPCDSCSLITNDLWSCWLLSLITDAKYSLQECRRVGWHFLGRGGGIAILLGGFGFVRIRADLLAKN